MIGNEPSVLLAFDTSNESIAIGIGRLTASTRRIEPLACEQISARRASNTLLLPSVDRIVSALGLSRGDIACVACGRGPGSFTGVRICLATAKGMASALEAPLYGLSTPDAIAHRLRAEGFRGSAAVVSDAMRQEVYPVRYLLDEGGIRRGNADIVLKAADAPGFFGEDDSYGVVAGDALAKYADIFAHLGPCAPPSLRSPTGEGLLLAAEEDWRAGRIDPFDARRGNPGLVLPIYTRLSDAEENERIRISSSAPRDLRSGVQQRARDVSEPSSFPDDAGAAVYLPLDAAHAAQVAVMEEDCMGSDAWNENLILDELPRSDRVWWAAFEKGPDFDSSLRLVGYAGGLVVDGRLEILKVACDPAFRRKGIARELLARVAAGARDLGAEYATLEVRASNEGARAFYEMLGFAESGRRPRYYSDREDALLLEGPLPSSPHDVAGMELRLNGPTAHGGAAFADLPDTLILAIESSCDETAAAVVDGEGTLLSDVVASQIDFHARFGGVVPEIASRKHIEAICGVADECLEAAAKAAGAPLIRWRDLSAVAVTYAPGLMGALVVGVAFAKGAAWGADIPLIGVNHMEGHLYANKIATPGIEPPLVVSLVSGGHTMLVHVKAWGDYATLGSTVDDAVGEAFDKVSKALGLGYPGGPIISRLASKGDPEAIAFPRAMLHSGDLRFSLSGLKTAVITYIEKEERAGRPLNISDIAASFERAVIDVQVAKARTALEQTGAREFCLGGGVAANPALRAAYADMCACLGVRLTMPPLASCTDNAGMIALAALDRYGAGRFFSLDADAHARASLDDPY